MHFFPNPATYNVLAIVGSGRARMVSHSTVPGHAEKSYSQITSTAEPPTVNSLSLTSPQG